MDDDGHKSFSSISAKKKEPKWRSNFLGFFKHKLIVVVLLAHTHKLLRRHDECSGKVVCLRWWWWWVAFGAI
jgi:hypothetical protein